MALGLFLHGERREKEKDVFLTVYYEEGTVQLGRTHKSDQREEEKQQLQRLIYIGKQGLRISGWRRDLRGSLARVREVRSLHWVCHSSSVR
ncbi:hypothetical protein Taro_033899 [Colocasia esculenta]|uniref:Uncharacterized protein n=1 Tax=Colocasia esculenta TaxID=4460 RepID=A0A843W609_COLES|nr:hypothetical protein [Colocasia esculenta]